VTGGLTPKNIEWIEGKDSHFMKAYADKGRVSSILSSVPLFAVMTEDLGVRGAIKCAQIVCITPCELCPWKHLFMYIFILGAYHVICCSSVSLPLYATNIFRSTKNTRPEKEFHHQPKHHSRTKQSTTKKLPKFFCRLLSELLLDLIVGGKNRFKCWYGFQHLLY
jgi:hypothetical protein